MESNFWIEEMLSQANSNSLSCSTTPEMIIEDNFPNDIFMKLMNEDSGDSITESNYGKSILGDDVITTIAENFDVAVDDQFVMNFDSLLDQVSSSSSDLFSLSSSLPPPPIYHQEFSSNQINIYQQQQHFASSHAYFNTDEVISIPADIKRELDVVEELVRAHSRHASDCEDNNSVSFAPKSEYASSVSSNCSLYGDDDKRPSIVKKRAYRRHPEERKSRKKEQNKNAAIKYRQKKKQEIEVFMDEGKILEKKHQKLRSIYKESRREVKILKNLMRELFQARGFI